MVGLPEETAKFIPLVIFVSLDRKNNEPLKFIIYASISALGFAFVENLIYFQKTSYGIIHGRAYITVIGHMFFSCLAAYAIVLYQFKYKMNNRIYFILMILIALIVSSILHGLFDLFLYQNQNFAFYILFIFSVQVWIIIINNSLNNASTFSYSKVTRLEYLQVFIAIALTLIFSLEYFLTSLTRGYEEANYQFSSNFWFAGFAIGFFSSNLSSFNLVRNYWRDIYFSSRERRGYGTMTRGSVLTNWYFVNSIRAHNYVGLKLLLSNDQHNRLLKEVIRTPFEAEIIDRLILCENGDQDPHWFLLKLSQPITIDNYTSKCVLVKLRYQEESLLQNENVQVFFRFVVDEEALNSNILQKEIFPPYGWARLNSFS
jgi:hypothetical protein